MTRGRNKRKTLPAIRLGLTHGSEGVPKFIRENTEQFFAAATRKVSKIKSASKPLISIESQPKYQQKQNNINKNSINDSINNKDDKKEENRSITSIPKPSTPMIIIPPIRIASSKRPNTVSSTSVCVRQPTLPPVMSSPRNSLESLTPVIKSPTPMLPLSKRQFYHAGPTDQDIFRRAYERALSVARSRLLFRDPYSLTRATATHGVLYSYYDHTPMCIFSRGTACNHRQDKTNKQERKSKANIFRKKIFDDVVVEHYMR